MNPARDHFEPYRSSRACLFTAVSPAQTTDERPFGAIWNPVRSSSHARLGFGFSPLRMSQRRYVPPSLGSALKTQPMLEPGRPELRHERLGRSGQREGGDGDEDGAHGCMLGPG